MHPLIQSYEQPSRYSAAPIKKAIEYIQHRNTLGLIRHTSAYMRAKLYSAITPFVRAANKGASFAANGASYNYCVSHRNATWSNERAVEIPYAQRLVNATRPEDVLEIGNVLSNYGPAPWLICDKYEVSERVYNADVRSLSLTKRFSLIISISTLEHVGFDEPEQDPMAVEAAIENLKRHLTDAGELHCTLPIGYNPSVDRLLRTGDSVFSDVVYLRRIGLLAWEECTKDIALSSEYGYPYNCANGLALCLARRSR